MSKTRESIKKILPAPILNGLREGRDALLRARDWPQATLDPVRRDTIQRLATLKDSRKGERCFILGNGPSLRQTDLSRLKNEATLGMNRIYMAFPEMGFQTSYFLSVNDLVVEQCAADIQALNMPRFVSWRARRWLKPQEDLYFLYTTYTGPRFAQDIRGRLWESATVTYVALQVAFFLGFQQVILIGVDHNFVTQGKPNTTVISQGDDPNHFNPGYFGKGFRWQLPDLDTSERGYLMARQAYEKAGREVVDATIGGKLRIFRRVEYDSLF
ncbi:MAG TPA: 6-hydroxymethylpterin diphosphokinase MptE-like protein [Anaerolineaceae bacterium]|nr:6-hydroxymethylpterin diphosphokinase MptE-like protein [Anaerolineaceae bacterium]